MFLNPKKNRVLVIVVVFFLALGLILAYMPVFF
jgi:hypothetical protein